LRTDPSRALRRGLLIRERGASSNHLRFASTDVNWRPTSLRQLERSSSAAIEALEAERLTRRLANLPTNTHKRQTFLLKSISRLRAESRKSETREAQDCGLRAREATAVAVTPPRSVLGSFVGHLILPSSRHKPRGREAAWLDRKLPSRLSSTRTILARPFIDHYRKQSLCIGAETWIVVITQCDLPALMVLAFLLR
jgi:hypothetical protein